MELAEIQMYEGQIPIREEEESADEERPKRRVLRRFVARGGKLVEVESVVRETR